MQHGVEAISRRGTRARYVVAAPRPGRIPHHGAFHTVAGPSPALARLDAQQPVVAVRTAARRLGTIGALPVEQERSVMAGASGMRWSPARVALRDHRRRSASPWRG